MAARYCVGTPLSSTAAWSATSGGASGASVPTAADDVHLDASSPSCTLDASMSCLTFDCTGYTHTLTHAASVVLTVAGTVLKLVAGMTYTLGSLTTSTLAFSATTAVTVTITTGGKTVGSISLGGGGVSLATYAQGDALVMAAGTVLFVTSGTFASNNFASTINQLNFNNTNTKTMTFGSSTVTIIGSNTTGIIGNSGGTTMTANTATFTFNNTSGGVQAASSFNFNGSSLVTTDTTPTMTAGVAGTITCANFTCTGAASSVASLLLAGNLTVTGTLTLTSNNGTTNRLLVQSSVVGTARTLTAAVLVCAGVIDWQDITAAGAATWTTAASGATYFGDCGGNSGITMTVSAPQTWSGNTTGNWSTAANWTSRVPLPQDNVAIPGLTSGTVTVDMSRMGANVDFTGSSGGVISNTTITVTNFGSWIFAAAVTNSITQSVILAGRGAFTLTSAGKSWTNGLTINAPGGTYTPTDTITTPIAKSLTLTSGSLDCSVNNISLSIGAFSATATATAVKMGSGTWTLTSVSAGIVWSMAAGVTLTPGTSTIVLANTSGSAQTFTGAGKTYNNLTITGGAASSFVVNGANTFNIVTIGQGVLLTMPASTTNTLTQLNATGAPYGYQYMPGVSGQFASIPNSAALQITGDIEIQARISPANYAIALSAMIIGKSLTAGQYSYQFYLQNQTLQLQQSLDGTAFASAVSTSLGGVNGTPMWVRVTRVAATGVVTFYKAADSASVPSSWTTVSSSTLASGNLKAGTDNVGIGATSGGGSNFYTGAIYWVRVLNGIGGTVQLDVNFATRTLGANSFAESSANAATVTINGVTAQVGDGRIGIGSSTPGTQATISCASGTIACDYLSLQDSKATGGASFFAGRNSTNVSNNTGWVFASAFFRTASDGATTVSDATTAGVVNHGRSASESVTLSDAAARSVSGTRTAADSTTVSDAATRAVNRSRASSEGVSVADIAARQIGEARTATDSASVGDVAIRLVAVTRTGSDSTGVTDVLTRVRAGTRALADGFTVTDALTRSVALRRVADDTLLFGDIGLVLDGVTRRVAFARVAGDTIAVSDTIVRQQSQARAAAENSSVSDAMTRITTASRLVVDGLGVADSLMRLAAGARSATDTLTVADGSSGTVSASRTGTDSSVVSDVVRAASSYQRTSVDSISATDSLLGRLGAPRFCMDASSWSDFAIGSTRRSYTRAVSETWAVSDSTRSATTVRRTASDAWDIADAGNWLAAFPRTSSDVLSCSDAASRTPYSRSRTQTEAFNVTDSLGVVLRLIYHRAVLAGDVAVGVALLPDASRAVELGAAQVVGVYMDGEQA